LMLVCSHIKIIYIKIISSNLIRSGLSIKKLIFIHVRGKFE
jgi:hypothetical protein